MNNEEMRSTILEFAKLYDAESELLDFVEYDPDIGRIPGRLEPKLFLVQLCQFILEKQHEET